MRVAQMLRHGQRPAGSHVFQRGVNGQVGAVALVGGGDINRRFRQRNPRLGPADKFRHLQRRVGQHQSHRVRQAHVLRRANHNPPRDEARVFAGVNHLRQPVQRRVRVAAAHGFDERGNCVVVRVLVVIHHGLFLDALLGGGQVKVNHAIFFAAQS